MTEEQKPNPFSLEENTEVFSQGLRALARGAVRAGFEEEGSRVRAMKEKVRSFLKETIEAGFKEQAIAHFRAKSGDHKNLYVELFDSTKNQQAFTDEEKAYALEILRGARLTTKDDAGVTYVHIPSSMLDPKSFVDEESPDPPPEETGESIMAPPRMLEAERAEGGEGAPENLASAIESVPGPAQPDEEDGMKSLEGTPAWQEPADTSPTAGEAMPSPKDAAQDPLAGKNIEDEVAKL